MPFEVIDAPPLNLQAPNLGLPKDLPAGEMMNAVPDFPESGKSTHGIELPRTGGGIVVCDEDIHPEIKQAAVSKNQAVIVDNNNVIIASMAEIDPDSVELACNDTGCALIPDDGNPHNDITPEQAM